MLQDVKSLRESDPLVQGLLLSSLFDHVKLDADALDPLDKELSCLLLFDPELSILLICEPLMLLALLPQYATCIHSLLGIADLGGICGRLLLLPD